MKGTPTRKSIPLRHLPLFWIGLLPVVILLWAWADSRKQATRWVRSEDRMGEIHVNLQASMLQINRFTITAKPGHEGEPLPALHGFVPNGRWGVWKRGPFKSPAIVPFFPAYHHGEVSLESFDHHLWNNDSRRIPFWLILLAYLPPWLGLTLWQARRKARLLAASDAASSPEGLADPSSNPDHA